MCSEIHAWRFICLALNINPQIWKLLLRWEMGSLAQVLYSVQFPFTLGKGTGPSPTHPQSGDRGWIWGSHCHRTKQGFLRFSYRYTGFLLSVSLHHDGTQPLLHNLAKSAFNTERGVRKCLLWWHTSANYVIMRLVYVNMQHNYVNMRGNNVNMQLNLCSMSNLLSCILT